MAGGLFNIVATGNNNVILNGNPSMTNFKTKYLKYTNFGMQKFRIDYEGLRELRLNEPSTMTFKIPRYAELLLDTFIVVSLPDIWSPIYHPCKETNNRWSAYDFRWIEDLGANMIQEIVISIGSQPIQQFSGEYLLAMVNRDFSNEKKELFDEMIGNVSEINDPANAYSRVNAYPSAYYTGNTTTVAEPSIRGRNLYIPINTWYSLNNKCAFPLVCLQKNEMSISVTFRPVRELFQIRDVFDAENNNPYISPDFNRDELQFWRFLQTPPSPILSTSSYDNFITSWRSDVHLMSTYCFLSKEEAQVFALESQLYLMKQIHEYKFYNVAGAKKVQLVNAGGMVSNWMWFLRRNDVNLRNEWSNYTNWPYKTLPSNVKPASNTRLFYKVDMFNKPVLNANQELILLSDLSMDPSGSYIEFGPYFNPLQVGNKNSGLFTSGAYSVENQRHILETMAIVFNGEYRENMLTRGIFDYVEKYTKTNSNGKDGLYCYNFCLQTNPLVYQPSGAINLSKFNKIEFELTTYLPQYDPEFSNFQVVCNDTGEYIGVTKQNWRLFEYNYNLTVFEERYNILTFIAGNAGLMYGF